LTLKHRGIKWAKIKKKEYKMRTLTLIFCVLVALILTCCTSVIKNTTVTEVIPTQEQPTATLTVIPTNTPTLEPTPTNIPTPTTVPTPTNLIYGNNFKTQDAYYDLFIEYGLLSAVRGDNITGNSVDGWNVVVKQLEMYFGPGNENEQGNIVITMGYGSKGKELTKKEINASKGSVFMILLRSPRIGFLYDPSNSIFLKAKDEIIKEDATIIMWVTSSGIVPIKDYSDPEWCDDGTHTYGYSINDKLFYWGREPDGSISCPIFKFLE
jgi:hypothetical protein